MTWLSALEGLPFFQYSWAMLLIFIMLVGVLADVSFGNRCSMLTNRGIITNGLYRYTKHPSYIASVLLMFFMFMPPLIFNHVEDAAQAFFAICGISKGSN